MSTAKWTIAGLSSAILAAGYSGRFVRLLHFNDGTGKLQLVKKLLDKLESFLRAIGDSHGKMGLLIDTFLDTSLEEFMARGEVIPSAMPL